MTRRRPPAGPDSASTATSRSSDASPVAHPLPARVADADLLLDMVVLVDGVLSCYFVDARGEVRRVVHERVGRGS